MLDTLKVQRDFVLDPSLVLYLPLCKLDGKKFMSQDAYGHLCTKTGALWRSTGHYFDGSDDNIACGTTSIFNFTSEKFTLAIWFKAISTLQSGYLFCRGQHEVSGWMCYFHSSGEVRLQTNQTGVYQRTDSTGWAGDTWYLATIVRDGTSIKIYRNAENKTTTPASHTNPLTRSDTLYVARYTTSTTLFKGYLSDALIYKRALTQLEIQRIYEATKWRYR